MIERKSSVIIYLDYCKGWTADRFFNPQSFCQSLGKYGLSDAEISYQCIDFSCFCMTPDLLTEIIGFFGTFCFNYHLLVCLLICTDVSDIDFLGWHMCRNHLHCCRILFSQGFSWKNQCSYLCYIYNYRLTG